MVGNFIVSINTELGSSRTFLQNMAQSLDSGASKIAHNLPHRDLSPSITALSGVYQV